MSTLASSRFPSSRSSTASGTLITHGFPLAQVKEAYDVFGNQGDGVVKVALTP